MMHRRIFGLWLCLWVLGLVTAMGCGNVVIDSSVCRYSGSTYSHAERFKRGDGCNDCVCHSGKVMCTDRMCEPSKSKCGGDSGIKCEPTYYCAYKLGECDLANTQGECKKIPALCEDTTEWFCGCDGKNYRNECEAAVAGVSIAEKGKCPDCKNNSDCTQGQYCEFELGKCEGNGRCKDIPKSCSEISPVCACDNKTYDSKCHAAILRISIKQNGECPKKSCTKNGNTYKDGEIVPSENACSECICDDGKIACSSKSCDCEYQGKTYKDGEHFPAADGCNECECNQGRVTCTLRACPAVCQSNSNCDKDHFCKFDLGKCGGDGKCEKKPSECQYLYSPVCGCDGNNYNNECTAALNGVSIQSDGECRKKSCNYNGKTYNHGEEFDANDGCNKCLCDDSVISCSSHPCDCLHNGNTYKHGESFPAGDGCNDCNCNQGRVTCTLRACPAICLDNSGCQKDQFCKYNLGKCKGEGKCEVKSKGCPEVYQPVCGCDGKTYSNECEASKQGVSVQSEGECKKKSCNYNGKTYNHGDKFEAVEGCNQCNCDDGKVTCSTACDCTQGGKIYQHGDTVINTGNCKCQCIKGNVICAPIKCPCTKNSECPLGYYCNLILSGVIACQSPGVCEEIPKSCTTQEEPVCGCDGRTYSNKCDAAKNSVSVKSEGSCS